MPNQTMIERVAAAICGEASWDPSSDNQKDEFRAQARDAIKAMREPTEAMVDDGAELVPGDERADHREVAKDVFRAMMDAASSQGE